MIQFALFFAYTATALTYVPTSVEEMLHPGLKPDVAQICAKQQTAE